MLRQGLNCFILLWREVHVPRLIEMFVWVKYTGLRRQWSTFFDEEPLLTEGGDTILLNLWLHIQ